MPEDDDDTTEFYKVVNDDADMLANAQALQEEEEPSMIAMMDVLQCLGVEPETANTYASSVARGKPSFDNLGRELESKTHPVTFLVGGNPSFVKLYGRGSLLQAAHGCRRNLNLNGGCSARASDEQARREPVKA